MPRRSARARFNRQPARHRAFGGGVAGRCQRAGAQPRRQLLCQSADRRPAALGLRLGRQELPQRLRRAIAFVVTLLCLALFVTVVWRLVVYGMDVQAGNEVTPTAKIGIAPFAYAASAALVPVCLALLHDLACLLQGKLPDEP